MSVAGLAAQGVPFAVVDVEHTGVAAGGTMEDARIVELAVVHVDPPTGVRSLAFGSLVRATVPIRAIPASVHGITDAHVADAPRFVEVAEHVASLLAGRVLVAHNVAADRPVLCGELRRAGHPIDAAPWPCTMRLAALAGHPATDLASVARSVYGRAAVGHAAASDAWSAARVLARTVASAPLRPLGSFADALHDGAPLPARATVPLPATVRCVARIGVDQLMDAEERNLAYVERVARHLGTPPPSWAAARDAVRARQRALGLAPGEIREAPRRAPLRPVGPGVRVRRPRPCGARGARVGARREPSAVRATPRPSPRRSSPGPCAWPASEASSRTCGRRAGRSACTASPEACRRRAGPGATHKRCDRPGYYTKAKGRAVDRVAPLLERADVDATALLRILDPTRS